MINKVILIGNLGRDPEIRTLESGAKVGKFSVATNENYRDKNGEWQTLTEWHNIVVWRAVADRAERELKKGSMVYIEGKLTHRSWQDKDGVERYTTEVVANLLRLLDRRESSGRSFGNDFPGIQDEVKASNPVIADKVASSPTQSTQSTQDTPPDDDDLPF